VGPDESYRGKWPAACFGYTFCPDTCPTTLSTLVPALEALGPLAEKMQPRCLAVDKIASCSPRRVCAAFSHLRHSRSLIYSVAPLPKTELEFFGACDAQPTKIVGGADLVDAERVNAAIQEAFFA
jgi:hypothetical protein